ncbi:MerR family transcriptional regulator [Halalkalibacillus halophilus]|uniref:MerR family transcriptional regulator n=1 Tax=Halalkalibacillus halophilus TaxID=392827 RepID=UPI000484762E|nr:MerR family transcriptional regulator [Halalkalibacillus halophilus]
MYNIKAVANMLDMPTVTIRAWEKRYEAISPQRTESGHRLYSEEDVHDLIWIKKQVDQGIKVSQAVSLLKEEKKSRKEPIQIASASSYEQQQQVLYQAIVRSDEEEIQQTLDLFFAQFHHKEVFFSIIAPVMKRVGEAWARKELSVAHEHMITQIIHQRFHHFFRVFPTKKHLPQVMALCPRNEEHQLGLLLFSLVLRENGCPVVYLGSNTPYEGLEELLMTQQIQVVCFSTTSEETHAEIKEYVERMKAVNPLLKFVIGGAGSKQGEKIEGVTYLDESHQSWDHWLESLI